MIAYHVVYAILLIIMAALVYVIGIPWSRNSQKDGSFKT
jgi:hypothetical protein